MNDAPRFEIVKSGPTRVVKAPFERVVLLCRKCAKSYPDKRFAKALKSAAKSRRWGRVRVVEAGCFDLCPKRRLVVATPDLLDRRRLMVVEAGTAPEGVLNALFPEPERASAG